MPLIETKSTIARLTLGRILALAVVLRGLLPVLAYGLVRDLQVFYAPDTQSYLAPAQSFLDKGEFAVDGVPEITRTPGYPLLLLPGILSGHLTIATVALQIALSVLTVYLVYRIWI